MQRLAHTFPPDWRLLTPVLVFLACIAAGLVVRHFLMRASRQWIAAALGTPLLIWILILAADLALRSSGMQSRYMHQVDVALLALWIVSLTMIAARIAGNAVRFWGSHVSGQAAATATLSRNLAQIIVYVLGILILLNHIGIDIRPLLTALGVGGLAVALALQDTMANLFAGFYISVAGQIRLGDYIKLNTGEEGYVVDITWRSTTLRNLNHNYVFVPNNKLGQANVTNFNLPEKKMTHSITVRVAYGTDAAQVERLLLEEAKDIAGLVAEDPVTVLWLPGFTDSALVLNLNYTVAEFVNQFGVQSELRRKIYERMAREGISLVVPLQVVNLPSPL